VVPVPVVAAALSLALALAPAAARADPGPGAPGDASTKSALASVVAGNRGALPADTTPVYFGNGCFWGRQKDFVDTEQALGRGAVSAVVGYAGGEGGAGSAGKVCYYYSQPGTVYEKLGHAEVVQVAVRNERAAEDTRAFARTYFSQFKRTPLGMIRLDPQDAGPGYRNVIGLPGGIRSPLMEVVREENVNGMRLVEGRGNAYEKRGVLGALGSPLPREDDAVNTVYVMDTDAFPFYRAENYHQFHNGIGKAFPAAYTRDLKRQSLESGLIGETGCPELPF